jgi:hypothetical protein
MVRRRSVDSRILRDENRGAHLQMPRRDCAGSQKFAETGYEPEANNA